MDKSNQVGMTIQIYAKHSKAKQYLRNRKQTKIQTTTKVEEQTNNEQMGEWSCLCGQIQSGVHRHSKYMQNIQVQKKCI